MTKQEQAELIALIDDVIERKFEKPHKTPITEKIKAWLMEQGTQRGLIVIIPMLICYFTDMTEQDALKIVYASLLLAFGHNAVTKG